MVSGEGFRTTQASGLGSPGVVIRGSSEIFPGFVELRFEVLGFGVEGSVVLSESGAIRTLLLFLLLLLLCRSLCCCSFSVDIMLAFGGRTVSQVLGLFRTPPQDFKTQLLTRNPVLVPHQNSPRLGKDSAWATTLWENGQHRTAEV